MSNATPTGRPFTVADLEAMPDDGKRYELIDGMLYVSPVPGWAHQEMTFAAYLILRSSCPRELRVIGGPFAVETSDDCQVQPDVLIARFVDIGSENLPVAPLLVIETSSDNTAAFD